MDIKELSSLEDDIDDFKGDFVEAWHRFQPLSDLAAMEEFVINEYNQAEKTVHVDYENTIILSVKLKNGYVVVEHAICMDPKQFDVSKGIEICKEKVLNYLLEIYEPVESKLDRR